MRKFSIIAILVAVSTGVFAQTTISLQDAINRATDYNLQLKQGAAVLNFLKKQQIKVVCYCYQILTLEVRISGILDIRLIR